MQKKYKKNSLGNMINTLRKQKLLSQLELALELDISSKHLSFIETGKSIPSRALILKIADYFKVPYRSRNILLNLAGYSTEFLEMDFDSKEFQIIKEAYQRILDKHEPFPAFLINSEYNILLWNQGYEKMVKLFCGEKILLECKNSIKILFSEKGFRNYVKNFSFIENFLLTRLEEEARVTQNKNLIQLLLEISQGKKIKSNREYTEEISAPVLSLVFEKEKIKTSFFTILATLGTPLDITSQELRVELFYPSDDNTKKIFTKVKF
jgi:transcriptional regulator with XRE-family HTH domain